MPLVANTDLPSFARLSQEGETVISRDYALHQDIRELHIGLLNMMPDKALEATERQFFRLVGESNQIAQFYVHPFTLKEISRTAQGQAHVGRYYADIDAIKEQGLDALIITGANVIGPELSEQSFWKPLKAFTEWAYENVTSTLCSCLATHALLEFRYGLKRRPLPEKRWGVYPHRVMDMTHPLVTGVNTRFDVPHSRYNQVDRAQFEQAGLEILVESEEAGVHLAVSEDGGRSFRKVSRAPIVGGSRRAARKAASLRVRSAWSHRDQPLPAAGGLIPSVAGTAPSARGNAASIPGMKLRPPAAPAT